MTRHGHEKPDAGGARSRIERLLASVADEARLTRRIDLISARFVGLPYAQNPLGGGPGLPEALTVSFDSFDCVTYMETALALALSADAGGFLDTLRMLRYEGGQVSWHKRNHYMTDWVGNNVAAGLVINLTAGPLAVEVSRRLSVIKALPERDVSFLVYRKQTLPSFAPAVETGDLVLFASAKRNLDFFHTGLAVRRGGALLLRHATRSAGAVVEEPLEDFLRRFRMSGVVLLRPVERA